MHTKGLAQNLLLELPGKQNENCTSVKFWPATLQEVTLLEGT